MKKKFKEFITERQNVFDIADMKKADAMRKLKKGAKVKIDSVGDDYHGMIGKIFRNFGKKDAMTVQFEDKSVISFGYDEISPNKI